MPNKVAKHKQLKPTAHSDVIIGAGEFTIPISYRWACTGDIVHITTKDRYRGIITAEIPVAVIRDILSQVDSPKVKKPIVKQEPTTPKRKPSIFDLLPPEQRPPEELKGY